MKKFKVFANGVKVGIFVAEDEDAALEMYAQKAGYQSVADMDEQLGSDAEYDVVEEENKMRKFTVYANGFNMGIFEGEDESAALESYAQEAGYQRLADMEEQLESVAEYEVVEAAPQNKSQEENTMKKFRVYVNHFDMGVFEAEDERAALEAYAQEAGYQSVADMNEQLESEKADEYDVVEVEA